MTELHELTALEQGAAIRRGELGAEELATHYLARIKAHDARVGAFVTVCAEDAVERARMLDRARPASRSDAPASPLYGVPLAIKDLTLTAGVRTTFGSAAFADFVPAVDADVVRLLAAAGTVSLGKTTTSELGCSLYSEGSVAPPARNPWSPEHTAGGSSGGSAAAVAAGLVPIAQGSDGGGSVRIPAAICGLVGIKPSRGLVSGGPIGFGAFGLPTHGPIGRTVADVAALLDVMAVPVPGEPYLSPTRPDGGFLAAAGFGTSGEPTAGRRPAPRLRIGRFTTPMLVDTRVDPSCVAAVDAAAAALAGAGHEVVDVAAPFGPDIWPLFEQIWYALALAPVPPEREDRLLPLTRWLRRRGAAMSAAGLMATLGELQLRVRHGLAAQAGVDLLLSPTLAMPQASVGWFTETGDPADDFDRQRRFSPYCAIYNVTGQPAVSLPVGASEEGLPVGVMLAGPVGADALLLVVAAELEQLLPWRDRHPAIWRAADSATVMFDPGSE
jgi:amidase